MTYSPEQLLTIIGALSVLITAIGVAIVNIVVALRTGQKADVLIHKTEEVANKVDQVHTLTNSNLSDVKAELTGTRDKLELLMQTIVDLKSERQIAQMVASSTPEAIPVKIEASDSNPVPVVDVRKPSP